MVRMMKSLVIVVGALVLLSALLAAPAGAKIVTSTEAVFDATGATEAYGEEIQTQITITPGDSEIRDLQIEISERDALIDGGSFKHTIIPSGAPVKVERNGHTFLCDRLAPGESIVLSFNAYPKTLVETQLTIADVTYRYLQQGDTVSGQDTITVDTSGSFWFQYLAASDKNATISWTLWLGIILIILSIVHFFYQISQRKKAQSEVDKERKRVNSILKEVSQKLDIIKDNPTVGDELKKRIERELKSQESVETSKISTPEEKPRSEGKKKSRFD